MEMNFNRGIVLSGCIQFNVPTYISFIFQQEKFGKTRNQAGIALKFSDLLLYTHAAHPHLSIFECATTASCSL